MTERSSRRWHKKPGDWPEFVDPAGPNPSGKCMCGCGGDAPLATGTNKRLQRIAGQPTRYIPGHHMRHFHPGYETRDCGYETPCHIWTGMIDANGYSRTRGRIYAHVSAYREGVGPIPAGHVLHHLCEQRSCVNPDHLEPVTRGEHRTRHRKYGPELVEEIQRATGSTRQIARQYGISKSHVALLRSR